MYEFGNQTKRVTLAKSAIHTLDISVLKQGVKQHMLLLSQPWLAVFSEVILFKKK